MTEEKKKIRFGKVLLSTMAAAIGVQNRKNHEEDFSQQSPVPYIVAGILFTALFVVALYFVAKLAVGG